MQSARVLVVLLVLVAFGGCSLLGADGEPALTVRTDEESYELARDEQIRTLIVNNSSVTISYSGCMGIVLEEIEDGNVVNELGFPACECICREELKPDQHIPANVSTINMDWIIDRSEHLRLEEDLRYRLRFEDLWDAEYENRLLLEERRSNRFRLIAGR